MKNHVTVKLLLMFLILTSITLLQFCSKKDDNTPLSPTASLPTLATSAISEVTVTTAVSGGNVTSDGNAIVTTRGVCWSNTQNPTISNSNTSNGTGKGSFISNLTGLIGSTTYYVRAYATNSKGTAYGIQKEFVTINPSTSQIITTSAISEVTETTAICGGIVTGDVNATITARGICWSTTENPTTANSKTSDGTGTGSFSSNITGLTANTLYFVRAYATNSQTTEYGEQKQFTTDYGESTPGSFTDSRDGNTYKTVVIGDQTWMAENLNFEMANSYCYDNKVANGYIYGRLYTWDAAITACPSGWHLPSDGEWIELADFLINNGYGYEGSGNDIAKSMASKTGWNLYPYASTVGNDQATNNSSGFNALPGGTRHKFGFFFALGTEGYWWSSTEASSLRVRRRCLSYANSWLRPKSSFKEVGFSVRCVRD